MRRATAAFSALLLLVVAVAVAEAAVLVLLLAFSYILRLGFTVQLADQYLQLFFPPAPGPTLTVRMAGVAASILITAAGGAAAAAWRYKRWRPA